MNSGVLFPAALFSFTLLLYDFHKGEAGIGKKYPELAYFSAISGNSGVQKGMLKRRAKAETVSLR